MTPQPLKVLPKNQANSVSEESNVSGLSSAVSNLTLVDEMSTLRHELDEVKKNATKNQAEYASVQSELNNLRKLHDDQIKRMEKQMHDLIAEIDDEKKTRLALHVELERLKKTIMNN
jgi:predicted RNase H-like nuclease (RuvC/YqgF family)